MSGWVVKGWYAQMYLSDAQEKDNDSPHFRNNSKRASTTLRKLSGVEQQLYFRLEEADVRVVNVDDVVALLGVSPDYARKILNRLAAKKAMERVKPGLYVRYPASIVINRGEYTENPFLVAAKWVKPYFFSYYSALTLHGLSQRYANTLYVTSTRSCPRLPYRQFTLQTIRVIPPRFFGFQEIDYGGTNIFVADVERTIVDVFDRPEYGGGWEEIVTCLADVQDLDWDRVVQYADRFQTRVLIHRLGYVFEGLQDRVRVPESFLRALKGRLSESVYYFADREGEYNREWRIIVAAGVREALTGA